MRQDRQRNHQRWCEGGQNQMVELVRFLPESSRVNRLRVWQWRVLSLLRPARNQLSDLNITCEQTVVIIKAYYANGIRDDHAYGV